MVWSLLFILRLPQSSACFGELVCNVSASVTGLTEFEMQWTKQLDQGAHTNRKAKKLQTERRRKLEKVSCAHIRMSSDLLILGSEEKTTMAVSEGLKLLAGYPLQLIKANFIAFGIPTGDLLMEMTIGTRVSPL